MNDKLERMIGEQMGRRQERNRAAFIVTKYTCGDKLCAHEECCKLRRIASEVKGSPAPLTHDKRLWEYLRSYGFERVGVSISGGSRLWTYMKRVDTRRSLTCQVWEDGTCRVSLSFQHCSDTLPTEFKTYAQLDAAIEKESTRMDSKWAEPGSLPSEQTHYKSTLGKYNPLPSAQALCPHCGQLDPPLGNCHCGAR